MCTNPSLLRYTSSTNPPSSRDAIMVMNKHYIGIICAVAGLFTLVVLASILMSCYKCIMKKRQKRLTQRTIEQEHGRSKKPSNNVQPSNYEMQKMAKYHQLRSDEAQGGCPAPGGTISPQTLKRHSMYYSIESMTYSDLEGGLHSNGSKTYS